MLDDWGASLARRIRSERLARAWTLDEMAERSGVSRAMVHRVETGRSSPTAALLGRISAAFRISLPMLLREAHVEPGERVMRADTRGSWQDPETGYVREPITAGAETPSSPVPEITRVTLPPGASVAYPKEAFEFISQVVWVLDGTLHFTEGSEEHVLGPDDCLTLGEPAPCTFANRATEPCTYVVVVA